MPNRARSFLKIGVLLVIAGVFAGIFLSPLRHHLNLASAHEFVSMMRGRVESLWWAPLAFIGAYAAGCIVAVPASLFIIFAGAVWGWKLGTLYSMCGGLLGASLSYFVGRFVGEGMLERFGKAGQMVSKQVKNAGFTSMLIVRLIPGPPFAVWNYGAGVAGVKFSDYFFGTLLGTLPAHLVFAYCADSIFSGAMTEGEAVKRLAIIGGLLIGMVLLTQFVKRRFAPKAADCANNSAPKPVL